jgi:formylglycine-generating enzyme required for sulfatase activity
MARIAVNLICSLLILFVVSQSSFGNNVEITNVTYDEVNNSLNFDISWDNAFYINSSWSDHVYIFAKYRNANGSTWESVLFETSGHSDDDSDMTFWVASNSTLIGGKRLAMSVTNQSSFTSGTQGGNCTAILADNIDFFHPSFKVFGIEMIQISNIGNDYYIGDGISDNRFHKGSDTTQAFFWEHDDFSTATVGNGTNDINTTHPDGIPVSTIPAQIFRPPNNIMKYEISQIQYVEFLNCLNRTAQNNRVGTDVSGTSITNVFVFTQTPTIAAFTRNGVRCDATLPNGGPITFYCDLNGNGVPNEYDDGQNVAMNYLSGEDLFAYLDWAGLRPINEIEYEQLCRGSLNPVPNEFAWGTSGYTIGYINGGPTNGTPQEFLSGTPVDGPLTTAQLPWRCGIAATATSNRLTSGASAYGIMDLTGGVSELVSALRSVDSYTTVPSVGDGTIDNFGKMDENWVKKIAQKGGLISNDAYSVSRRFENTIPYITRSGFCGGRGGY